MRNAESKRTNHFKNHHSGFYSLTPSLNLVLYIMTLYIDGGCSHSNQKNQDIRELVWIITDENGTQLFEGKGHGGSNNIAEFLALKDAIKLLPKEGGLIFTDSRNNLAWLEGRIGKKLNNVEWVKDIYREICEMDKKFDVRWIPREQNKAGWIIEEKYSL